MRVYKTAMVLLALVFLPIALRGQDAEWKHTHSKDAFTDKESDQLLLQGRYRNATPSVHDEGTPAIKLFCSGGEYNRFAIVTGVVLDTNPNTVFGATIGNVISIRTRIDEGKPKIDETADVAEDFKTLTFNNLHLIGGTDIFFAKKFIVAAPALTSLGTVEMEFDIPSDSSPVERYCGIKRNSQN